MFELNYSLLHLLFMTMNEGVAIHEIIRDETGKIVNYRIVDVNPAYEVDTGLTRAQVVGKLATEAYGVTTPPYLSDFAGVVETGKLIRFDSAFEPLHKTFSISVVALGSDSFATVFTDITEEKRQNQLLRNSEERLRIVFDHSLEGLYVRTLEGEIVEMNQATLDMLGYTREEMLGKNLKDLQVESEKDIKRVADVLSQLKQHELSESIEVELKKKDGSTVLVEAQVAPMVVGNEQMLFGMLKNLTLERKVERKNREHELFLEQVIENIPAMIFVKDANDLKFIRFNQAGANLIGVTRQEMIGKNDFDFFPKEEAEAFIAHDKQVLAEGKLLDIPEEKLQTKDKGLRLLHTRKIPILDEEGKPLYLLGISDDITEQKNKALNDQKTIERIERQRDSLIAISKLINQSELDLHSLLAQMMQMTAEILGVERVSNWKLSHDETSIELIDLYNRFEGKHTSGTVLDLANVPLYLEALKNHRAISSIDVLTDNRMTGFLPYFTEHKITSLLDASVRVSGRLSGLISVETGERREWADDEIRFASEVADQLAQAVINQEKRLAVEQFEQRSLELERTNRIMVGRELRMVELKKEIERLKGGGV